MYWHLSPVHTLTTMGSIKFNMEDLSDPIYNSWALVNFQSKSHEHLAWRAVCKLYTDKEMKGRNCRAVSNVKGRVKLALDERKMMIISKVAVHFYPIQCGGLFHDKWSACQRAIDSNLRSKYGKEN